MEEKDFWEEVRNFLIGREIKEVDAGWDGIKTENGKLKFFRIILDDGDKIELSLKDIMSETGVSTYMRIDIREREIEDELKNIDNEIQNLNKRKVELLLKNWR